MGALQFLLSKSHKFVHVEEGLLVSYLAKVEDLLFMFGSMEN